MKLYQSLILSIISVLMLSSCDQKLKTLGKESLSIELSIDKDIDYSLAELPNPSDKAMIKKMAKEAIVYSIYSPPVLYLNQKIYFRALGRVSKIIKVSIDGKSSLSISSQKNNLSIVRLTGDFVKEETGKKLVNKKDKIPITFKQYNFDHILDFAVNDKEDIFVMNYNDPSEKEFVEKKPEVKIKAKRRPKAQVKKQIMSEPIRYILKFNDKGEFLYKIGVEGKDGKAFSNKKTVHKMVCDSKNNLYLFLKRQKSSSKNFDELLYELYRYNSKDKIDLIEKNLKKLIPVDKKYNSFIEQIEVTPSSEKLLILVTYYPKSSYRKGKKYEMEYKKLYFIDLSSSPMDVQLVTKLEKAEKYYKIFGITKKDEIYLTIPIPRKNLDNLQDTRKFQVIDHEGNYIEQKSLIEDKNPEEIWKWFYLGRQGEVVSFIETKKKVICNFYR